MIAVEVARARVLAGLKPLPAEQVALPDALGRVLAADIAARIDNPPVAVSAMDGYALRAADLAAAPATLTVTGESAAGRAATVAVGPGEAVRIFTGAPVPAGADTVVIQEDTSRDGDRVTVAATQAAGRHIRAAGADFATGQPLLTAGTLVGARHLGLAAAMNIPWLPVRRRPRVAVISTGDEIVMPGEPLAGTQIVSSNGPALCALIAGCGGQPVHLGIARDSRDSLSAMVAAAAGCDLLVTSGGASVGDYDLVRDVLSEQGLELDFWKIAMRPGKPLMFGRLKHVPVLGLPGNPVSAMVGAYLFLVPMLNALSGLAAETPLASAILGAAVGANDARQDHLRATLSRDAGGALVATPLAFQDSAALSGLAAAGCLIVRPPHAPPAKAGECVPVLPLAPHW
ncbi:gephyrin-like molybdotransferase Glp [Magnetospirillum sp. UT-4]|uniref:molybdopterin molybdotransferase MoeA n=1 Tax=Magnetospirillum sp. UT-4 TaxID=2681467 RepID=UPI001383280C|nr:gephyrin-like molybdotransferase Glp [Magnetospirillum sp. UT-4]CAA7615173.1 Molybdopterin biosynthesis enzyme [Magnetospirillum sp. UT-4]